LKALAVVKSVGQTMEQKFIGALDLSDYVIITILNFLTADSPRYGHPSLQGRRRWTQTLLDTDYALARLWRGLTPAG